MPHTKAGFTLLEVLIALSLVSIIGVFTIHQIGQSQIQISQTKQNEEMQSEGRMLLIELVKNKPNDMVQQGTLAPRFPDIEYSSHLRNIENTPYQKLVLTLTDKRQQKHAQFTLEYFLP